MNALDQITPKEALALVRWFQSHERSLPWRHTGDPYQVWLSEIMLQQTRVEFVKERFLAFRSDLPDITSLAACSEDHLMKLWEGMGYYSRARNLQKCARVLCEQYHGQLPADPSLLQQLPGIGPYTAGAISALAFGIPVPAVDGNVLRVLTRLFGITDDIREPAVRLRLEQDIAAFYETSGKQLRQEEPTLVQDFTQGLMELGAIVCVPNGAPHCEECPWQSVCHACREHSFDRIPFRSPLRERRIIDRTILVIRDGSRFLLRQRPKKGLLAGLYEFPGIDGTLDQRQAIAEAEKLGAVCMQIHRLPDSRHVFTHLEWHMTAYEILTASVDPLQGDGILLLNKKELAEFAVPSAFHAYLEYYDLKDQPFRRSPLRKPRK